MLNNKTLYFSRAIAIVFALFGASSAIADDVDASIKIEKQMDRDAARSQRTIDKFEDERDSMNVQYREILEKIDQNRIYNKQLERTVNSLKEELVSMQTQIDGIEDTEKGLAPLMNEMIEALDQFVSLDLPFEVDFRTKEVQKLRDLMGRGDVSTSEKFRRILEAYQFEVDYGSEVKAFADEIDGIELEFLRFGRVAYINRTRDGKEANVWNNKTKQWEFLPSEYFLPIRNGLRMARNEAQKGLVTLPIQAAEEASK